MGCLTSQTRLDQSGYLTIDQFGEDVSLVFTNAMTYNAPESDVFIMAQTLNKVFRELHEKKTKKRKEKKKDPDGEDFEPSTIQH